MLDGDHEWYTEKYLYRQQNCKHSLDIQITKLNTDFHFEWSSIYVIIPDKEYHFSDLNTIPNSS